MTKVDNNICALHFRKKSVVKYALKYTYIRELCTWREQTEGTFTYTNFVLTKFYFFHSTLFVRSLKEMNELMIKSLLYEFYQNNSV